MAEALAPIDQSIALPPAIRAAAARAEQVHKAAYTPEPAPQPEPAPTPAPEPVVAQTPEPSAPAPTPAPEIQNVGQNQPVSDETYQLKAELEAARAREAKQARDYQALLGRNAQQRDYIALQQNQLRQLSSPRSWAEPQKQLISDKEREAYGDELLSVVARKAQEVIQPAVQSLREQNQALQNELQNVKAHDVYSELDQKLPTWEKINDDPKWIEWLSLPDLYSGVVRQQLLDRAFSAGDAGRILAFFKGFQQEHPEHMGQPGPTTAAVPPPQAPVRKAAVKLETLAAPGRASPSPPPSVTSAAPEFTNKDVSQFYRDVQRGVYAGREEAKAAREAEIHAAVREGRVRMVK